MLFFALLIALTLAAYAVPALAGGPARMRVAMALALVLVGADHWLTPGRYLVMMPPAIPYPLKVVLFTGAGAIPGLPAADWYYWLRLPLQAVAVWWALYSTECVRWPFAARTVEAS